MFTITMSTRGQFVLPKAVRERLKLIPGCTVEGSIDLKGRLILVPVE
jgi:bifunctional DNA-binding transcriptional regulator/antitoxin component of YhaV-PrlF toxin-antitoxin module